MGMREAQVKTAKSFSGGMEALSYSMGMGANGLRNRIYELKGQQMFLQTAQLMQELTKTTFIVEQMAIESGGIFVKLPDVSDVSKEDLNDKFMKLHADIGAMCKKYFEATRDNEIDLSEREDLTDLMNHACKSMHEWLALSFLVFCK